MQKNLNRVKATLKSYVPIFSALGDETRLMIVYKLTRANSLSISQLTEGTKLSRQAVTKHLHVLQNSSLVHCSRSGRESLFELNPAPIKNIKEYLDSVSAQWDEALSRLKSFIEKDVFS